MSSPSSPSSTPTPPPGPDSRQRALIVQAMLLGGLIVALLTGGAALLVRRPEPPPVTIHPPPTPVPTATPSPLVVHVNGAVVRPGLYTLPPGARAGDALAAAGGMRADADGEGINQAEPLFDGAQLYVPPLAPATDGAADASSAPPVALPAAPPAGLSGAALPPAAPTLPTVESRSVTVDLGQAPVNINTASAAELEALPGIGPERAADIIANRPYASLTDLDAVPGIGPATLERLRNLVVIE